MESTTEKKENFAPFGPFQEWMKGIRGIILFSFLAISSLWGPAHARDLVQPALSIEGMTQEQQRVYLDGLADGFQIINAKLQRQGQQPIYCIPEKIVILGRDLLEFAAEDLQGPQEDLTIAVSGLLGLIERYPCSKDDNEIPPPAEKPVKGISKNSPFP